MKLQRRFIVEVDEDWNGTVWCAEDPAWRRALPLKRGAKGFPDLDVPLHDPGTRHSKLQGGLDGEAVQAEYDDLMSRRATAAQVGRFGHYLFDALLGHDLWSAIEQKTEDDRACFLELALCLPVDDPHLHRLNWELMRSDARFLVGPGKITVAITRIFNVAVDEPEPLDVPPRVLYVVGTSLTDKKIRPGAELYSLLRQARRGRAMRYRLLERAKPSELRQAVAEFKPQVVHFICHGVVDGDPPQVKLDLAHDEENVSTLRTAGQLLTDLRPGGWSPTVVVLSACLTAGEGASERTWLAGAHEAAPFAAKLVAGGIPIVVGMSGRVSDIASRLFARQLSHAVMRGESLVRATAIARRAAFGDAGDPESTVDWALPAVFLAASVKPTYKPLDISKSETEWSNLERWIKLAQLTRDPVFCGREDLLARFHRMFDPAAPKHALAVLAGTPEKGLGRTRLLQEFAAQALGNGHVPLLVTYGDDEDPPRDHKQLVRALAERISFLRNEVLELARAQTAQLRLLARQNPDDPDLDPLLADDLADHDGAITDIAVGRALRADLELLLVDAADTYPFFARAQAVVLLDDIDRYGDELIDGLLDRDLLGPTRIGVAGQPIPVALTCSRFRSRDSRFQALELSPPGWLDVVPLGPFRSDGEDLLASQLVLLNPFTRSTVPPELNIAYVHSATVGDDVREQKEQLFRLQFKGMPQRYADDGLIFYASNQKLDGYFVEATDDDRVEQLEKQV